MNQRPLDRFRIVTPNQQNCCRLLRLVEIDPPVLVSEVLCDAHIDAPILESQATLPRPTEAR